MININPHLTVMKKIIIFSFLLSYCFLLEAQRKGSPSSSNPAATSSASRLAGFEIRKKITNNSLVKDVPFRNIGPTVMSGRVVDVEADPNDPTHFYVAYASGGLWETTNNGITFEPIFDNQMVMTIGDIAVNWRDNILFVGTGENNSSRSSYSGTGVFKSRSNGKKWKHVGLPESHHISRIVVHPSTPNTVWVAVLGHLYSDNSDRGVYKSNDGGNTWSKTLYVDEGTGAVDLVIDPTNSDILYAAMWSRDRKAWNFRGSGTGSGIYKSTDGGQNWTKITTSTSGFPSTKGTGRIGLDISKSNPNILYAILDNQDRKAKTEEESDGSLTKTELKSMSRETFITLDDSLINLYLKSNYFPKKYNAEGLKELMKKKEITPRTIATYKEDANSLLFDTPVIGAEMYRSDDAGKTWKKTHSGSLEGLYYSYGYYFGQVRIDAKNPDLIYTMGVPLIKSKDGGTTWENINGDNQHGDHHALWLNPNKTGHLINGNDGGINISYDDGANWIKSNQPSVGQFYDINYDMAEPYNVYGGLQDNGVWVGSSKYEYSTNWQSRGKYQWTSIMGGDGMQTEVDTRDNATVYTGWQFGNYYRVNTKTQDVKRITPMHELGDKPFRWNWEAPIHLSRHNQDIFYMGSNKFHRSMNQGEDFETLSGDLTKGGKKGNVSYGTLTTVVESPLRFGLIYVGSDDGMVQVSKDGGYSWGAIIDGLPQNMWVSSIVPSNHVEGRVYLTLNGYRWDNFDAMVYVSENYGASWKNIGNSLPKEPVNAITEDPKEPKLLYVGTDHGVYASLNRGSSFMAMQNGLSNAPVHDLVVHPREMELIVGTHGRSISIADIKPLQTLAGMSTSTALKIMSVEKVQYSENWGERKNDSPWSELNDPSTKLVVYSNSNSSAKMEVYDESYLLYEKEIQLNRGLNYLDYYLNKNGDATSDDEEPPSNGRFYLEKGVYQIEIVKGEVTETADLMLE